jgi:hypothetical protein
MNPRYWSWLALLLFLVGCSHLHPWATDRDIEGSYDRVFQATLTVLEDRQFPITKVDREEGRIVTGKRPVHLIEAYRRVETVRARIEPEDGEETDVTLFLTLMDQSGTVHRRVPDRKNERVEAVMDKAFSSSAIYDDYLDAIEQRVKDLREENEE